MKKCGFEYVQAMIFPLQNPAYSWRNGASDGDGGATLPAPAREAAGGGGQRRSRHLASRRPWPPGPAPRSLVAACPRSSLAWGGGGRQCGLNCLFLSLTLCPERQNFKFIIIYCYAFGVTAQHKNPSQLDIKILMLYHQGELAVETQCSHHLTSE